MDILETRALTKSDSNETELYVTKHTNTEADEEYLELRRTRARIIIGRTGAECIGECEGCSLSRSKKNHISIFSDIKHAISSEGKELSKVFDVKTYNTCDVLDEVGGILRCPDAKNVTIEPNKESYNEKEGVLYVQNSADIDFSFA